MKNNNKLVWIILGLLLLALIIYVILKPEEQFKTIELKKENYVVNRTDLPYLDTITHVGLEELKIKGITIMIRYIDGSRKIDGDYELNGYIIANKGGGNSYLMYLKKGISRLKAIDIISHELIHINQYIKGDLVLLGDGYILWEEKEFQDITLIPYPEREWEIEAFHMGPVLRTKLSNKLYE
jgi:hypothetical protein